MNGKYLGITNGVIKLDNKGTYLEIPVSGATPLPAHEKAERACEVLRNGKPASLTDLRQGDDVSLDGKPVLKIVATGTDTAAPRRTPKPRAPQHAVKRGHAAVLHPPIAAPRPSTRED